MQPRSRRPETIRAAPTSSRSQSDRLAPGAEMVEGLRAGLALFAHRRTDVVRVAFAASVRSEVKELVRWARSERLPCTEMGNNELDRLAGSAHHEGLLVVARERAWHSIESLTNLLVRSKGVAIALDRVRNPYNIGAILRCAAFFGADALLVGAPAPHPGLPPSAVRVAEGGVEHLRCFRTTDLGSTLSKLRARGIHVVGSDSHDGEDARDFVFVRPSVLVVGHEREGLGPRVRAECDATVTVRGTGAVESLNVAVVAGILLAKIVSPWRGIAKVR